MEKIESYIKSVKEEIDIISKDYSSSPIQPIETTEIVSNYPSYIEGVSIYNIEQKPFERVIATIKL